MAASDAMDAQRTTDTSSQRAAQREYDTTAAASTDVAQSPLRTCALIGSGPARLRAAVCVSIFSSRNAGNFLPGVMDLSWRRCPGLEYSKVNT